MLCDEVTSQWVKASREEAGREQVYERADTTSLDENIVKDKLHDEVGDVPLRELLRAHKSGTQGVEKYLECTIRSLSR